MLKNYRAPAGKIAIAAPEKRVWDVPCLLLHSQPRACSPAPERRLGRSSLLAAGASALRAGCRDQAQREETTPHQFPTRSPQRSLLAARSREVSCLGGSAGG